MRISTACCSSTTARRPIRLRPRRRLPPFRPHRSKRIHWILRRLAQGRRSRRVRALVRQCRSGLYDRRGRAAVRRTARARSCHVERCEIDERGRRSARSPRPSQAMSCCFPPPAPASTSSAITRCAAIPSARSSSALTGQPMRSRAAWLGGLQHEPRPAIRSARAAMAAVQSRAPQLDKRSQLRIWWREIDRVLLALILVLMAIGTVAVAAASPASARRLSTSRPATGRSAISTGCTCAGRCSAS